MLSNYIPYFCVDRHKMPLIGKRHHLEGLTAHYIN